MVWRKAMECDTWQERCLCQNFITMFCRFFCIFEQIQQSTMNPICPQDLTPAKVLSAPTNCQLAADLEIGTANPSTAYDVFIVHNGSKKVLKYDIVSSVSGMLTIDLTVNPLFFNNTTTYTLFVVADGDDVANFVPIDGAYDGFLLTFWRSDTAAPSTQMIQPQ